MLMQKLTIRFHSTYAADKILSAENRARCLKCLQAMPSMRMRLGRKQKEEKHASVLIPVCVDEDGKTSLLYTRRSGQLRRHVHQISFPGGLLDEEDDGFEDCALRETEEEIGLPRNRIEIIGSGPMMHTIDNTIMPVYGIVRNLNINELKLNKAEVEDAFTISIADLASPECFRYTQYKLGYSGPVFLVGKNRIWGITGHITNTFLQCLLPEEESRKRPKIKYISPFRTN